MEKDRFKFDQPVAIDRLCQDPLQGIDPDKIIQTEDGPVARDDSDAGVVADITKEDYASKSE